MNQTNLLAALRVANRGDWSEATKLGIQMNGFDWDRDFALCGGSATHPSETLRAVAVSRVGGSYLFVFRGDGELLAKATTPGEILSIEVFDFDANGCDEVITRQKTGWGTGVYVEEFIIYGLVNNGIRQLWRAPSYTYEDFTQQRQDFEDQEGFIRPSDGHLLYLSQGHKGTSSRQLFRFDGENFIRARE